MAENSRRAAGGGLLSAQSIVEAALRLTEREGAGALTMRRLGQELGVDPTAVYRYYRDKDDLLLAVTDRLYAEAIADFQAREPIRDWREALRQKMYALRRVQLRHPAITSLTFARITGGDSERLEVEFLLGTLRGTGLSDADAVLYYRCLVDVTLSLSGLAAHVATLDASLRRKDNSAWVRVYGALSRTDFPNVTAAAEELATVDEEVIFRTCLDAVIERIDRAAKQSRKAARTAES